MENRIITGEELVKSFGPIVYIWSRGDDTLYVGMSIHGLGRPFGCHHVINIDDTISSSDTFTIIYCESAIEAQNLEINKIIELSPIYNRTANQTPEMYIQRVREEQETKNKEYKIFPKKRVYKNNCRKCKKEFVGDAKKVYCSLECSRVDMKKRFYTSTRQYLDYIKLKREAYNKGEQI